MEPAPPTAEEGTTTVKKRGKTGKVEKKHKCLECGRPFAHPARLANHRLSAHNVDVDRKEPKASGKKTTIADRARDAVALLIADYEDKTKQLHELTQMLSLIGTARDKAKAALRT